MAAWWIAARRKKQALQHRGRQAKTKAEANTDAEVNTKANAKAKASCKARAIAEADARTQPQTYVCRPSGL